MEEDDKGCPIIRMGVSGWMFLLVPAYPGSPGQKAVKRLCVCVCLILLVGREKENRCLYTRSFFTRTGGLRTKGSGQAPGLWWSLIFVITPSDYCHKVCKNVCLQAGCHSSSLRVAEKELGVNGVLSYEAWRTDSGGWVLGEETASLVPISKGVWGALWALPTRTGAEPWRLNDPGCLFCYVIKCIQLQKSVTLLAWGVVATPWVTRNYLSSMPLTPSINWHPA